MKLYGHPLSSCTRKVLVTLAEKGHQAAFFPVDLFTGEHKKDAHLARHPFGVIPVLDDEGFVLLESRAIIRYLDARLVGTPLTPASPMDVARMNQWLSVDQSYVAPHTRTLALERIVRKGEGLAPDASVVNAAETALARSLGIIDRALDGRTYLASDTFSLADISLMPYVASLPIIGAERLIGNLPRLGAWWANVRERPSWKRALQAS